MSVNIRRGLKRWIWSGCSILAISAIMFFSSACVVATERSPHYVQEQYGRPVDLHRIEGRWFVTIANNPGKLEFYWEGNRWTGQLWIDYYAKWEPLTDIFFDPRKGESYSSPGPVSTRDILGLYLAAKIGDIYLRG